MRAVSRGRTSKRLRVRMLAALTSLYWLLFVAWGIYRLRTDGLGAAMIVLRAWYIAALVFIGVWGGAALLSGLIMGGSRKIERMRRTRPVSSTLTLRRFR